MKELNKEIKMNKMIIVIIILMTVIVLGIYPSYSLFQNKTIKNNIIEIHTSDKLPLKNGLTTELDESNSVTDEEGIIYLSGSNEKINFNYVWYSGKLWRITSLYPDGRMKMITENSITIINWGSNENFEGSFVQEWLNEDFKDTLYNYENIIETNAKWNVTPDSNEIPVKTSDEVSVYGDVGLLTAYEYYQSYKIIGSDEASAGLGYLNNGFYWWLITPHSADKLWFVRYSGYSGGASVTTKTSNVFGIRPTVILKASVNIIEGDGTKEKPYIIEGDKEETKVNEKLNERLSGEYVNFNNLVWRIVGTENKITKLISEDYLRSGTTVITKAFSSANTNVYYGGTGTTSTTYWEGYLNTTWYNSIESLYKDMMVEDTYYLGMVEANKSYKNSICSDLKEGETTKNCTKTTKTWRGYVGLPREGEMFISQIQGDYNSASDMWLLTPNSNSGVRYVLNQGHIFNNDPYSYKYAVRPTITLSSDVVIVSGDGRSPETAFEISLL